MNAQQPTVERWLFLALLVKGAHPDHDPDSLADDIAWSVNRDGRLGEVEVGGIPGPQWLTPETLATLRAQSTLDHRNGLAKLLGIDVTTEMETWS